jgi:hypothetical protein
MREIQWYSGGSGGGVRSWALYGVSKVHLWSESGRTLCGLAVPPPSKRLYPDLTDARCKRCAKKADD